MNTDKSIVYRAVQTDEKVTVFLRGRIDSTSYTDFAEQVAAADTEMALTADFEKVEYISSAGLRVLMSLMKKHGGAFTLVNVPANVMDVLDTTGFLSLLHAAPLVKKTPRPDYPHCTFAQILSFYATNTPEAVFITANGKDYTWTDIDRISRLIASDLASLGVRRYSHVALCSPECVEQFCAFFAVQLLGGIAVMVNPAFTPGEIAALSNVGDFDVFCFGSVISPDRLAEYLCAVTAADSYVKKTYSIMRDYDARAGEYETLKMRFSDAFDPDDPCLMICTSGSTGTPKGALHSCTTLCLAGMEFAKALGAKEADKYCHILPSFHIAGLAFDVMSALICGGRLIIPCYEGCTNIVERMTRNLETIEKYECDFYNAVPTMLLSVVGLPSFTPARVRSVKCILTGSQPITERQMALMTAGFAASEFVIVYGMTEMVPASYVFQRDTKEHFLHTVGKAAAGVTIEIIDADGRTLGVGETGEICLAGPQSICGYYKIGLDKQPLSETGCIRTGDLGYLDADGYLHLAGRIKDIIIRGGENIVPGEIALALAALDGIADVYVCGVPDAMMGEKVAAAVIMKDGFPFDEAAVKKTLLYSLAKHKVPSYFVVYDAFPLLGNGKTDKVKLKKMIETDCRKE